MDFTRFCEVGQGIREQEQLVNGAIRGVNGWMWLAMIFMALYYFLNFWSIALMMINLVVTIYEVESGKNWTIFLTLGSLLLSFLDLWLNSKEKSIKFHRHWFKTSEITKEYIVKFLKTEDYDELCRLIIEFNNLIYKENSKIRFL